MKAKHFISSLLLIATFFLTGCEVLLSNLTPRQLPENASGIYTLAMEAKVNDANVLKDSLKAYAVIDGKRYRMASSQHKPSEFIFEYSMPQNQNLAKYYFELIYDLEVDGYAYKKRIAQSKEVFNLELINRYVVSMQSNRGTVGAIVPIYGCGFSQYDKIFIGDVEAETLYTSSNAIAFKVPCLPINSQSTLYPVTLDNGQTPEPLEIGDFRVDSSAIKLSEEILSLHPHEQTILIFQIDNEAPGDGIPITVETTIGKSIIMPEVTIPGGSRTVSISVEGGEPGVGFLYVSAPGFQETILSVNVAEEFDDDIEAAEEFNDDPLEHIVKH